ncbi:hypothetical protein NKG94_15765 [Micromonospora sp. M12]
MVAAALTCAGPDGAVLLGHLHNARHPSGTTGLPLPRGLDSPAAGCPRVRRGGTDGGDCRRAAARAGRFRRAGRYRSCRPGRDASAAPADPALLRPAPASPLLPNPLYDDGIRRWPDPRWAAEYGDRAAAYLPEHWPTDPGPDAVRRRLLLDLPERW